MLRRRVGFGRGAAVASRRTLFKGWNKTATEVKEGAKGGSFGANLLPGGLDVQRLREMQSMLAKRSPAEQKALFEQVLAMQKDLKEHNAGGFMERMRASAEAMAKMLEEQKTQTETTTSPEPRSATTASATARPTLDQLKQIDLGPEIEALFDELRSIRAKKNQYREQYRGAQAALEQSTREQTRLAEVERDVRARLRKAEQEVVLLRDENVQLGEAAKRVKELTRQQTQLEDALREARSAAAADKAEGGPGYRALQQQLHTKEATLRSLQRKVDRLRLRDPLLQFSLVCSDVARLAGRDEGGVEAVQSEAEMAFETLRTRYEARQRDAWTVTATEDGAAAKAYLAAVRSYLCGGVPLARYDAVVTVATVGEVEAVQEALEQLGLCVVTDAEDATGEATRLCVTAATPSSCPYGCAIALFIATHATDAAAGFVLTAVQPYVSAALVQNVKRSRVTLDTARASGPGGQATNVSETQIYARLEIDGVHAYTAEAQDSRSALNNRDAALEKLRTQRRQQYNEQLARDYRAETVYRDLVTQLAERGVGGGQALGEVQRLVQEAVRNHHITAADALLAKCMQRLREAAAPREG